MRTGDPTGGQADDPTGGQAGDPTGGQAGDRPVWSQCGSGTLLIVAAIAVVATAGWVLLLLMSAVTSRAVASAAADLGAHGAAALLADPAAPLPEPWPAVICAHAASLVEANGARLRDCSMNDPDGDGVERVTVSVAAPTAPPLHRLGLPEVSATSSAEVRYG